MSDIKMKPCPFCGSDAEKKTEGLSEVYAYANQVTYSCKSCGCSKSAMGDTSKGGYADNSTTEVRALESWNKRSNDTLVAQNKALKAALAEISNMCIGDLAMGYKLDSQHIGELIWNATGMTNPELNKALEWVGDDLAMIEKTEDEQLKESK